MSTRPALATIAAVLLGALGAGCGHGQYVWAHEMPPPVEEPPTFRLAPGDRVYVSIWNQSQLTGEQLVRADGNVTLPLVGDVAVGGLTPTDAAEQIKTRLEGLVVNPQVVVAVQGDRPRYVSVLGEVKSPGRYPLEAGDNVLHLIAKAGGLTEFAASDSIFLVRGGESPLRVRFSMGRLADGDARHLGFRVKDGDVIVVE